MSCRGGVGWGGSCRGGVGHVGMGWGVKNATTNKGPGMLRGQSYIMPMMSCDVM